MKSFISACVLALTVHAPPASAQTAHQPAHAASIELGWIAAVQQDRAWRITQLIPAQTRHRQEHLERGDLLLAVAGQDVSGLGPLALAWLLEHVPFETVPLQVERNGNLRAFHGFGMDIFHGGEIATITQLPGKLPKKDDLAPQFSLPDLYGQNHTVDRYRGQWLLINVWGTWCEPCWQDIPALNYLRKNHSTKLTVLSIAINDSADTLTKFLRQHPISYPVLLGGTFDDPFARSYLIDSTPTNLVIAPDGVVLFVGRGPGSLEGAMRIIAGADRAAPKSRRRDGTPLLQ